MIHLFYSPCINDALLHPQVLPKSNPCFTTRKDSGSAINSIYSKNVFSYQNHLLKNDSFPDSCEDSCASLPQVSVETPKPITRFGSAKITVSWVSANSCGKDFRLAFLRKGAKNASIDEILWESKHCSRDSSEKPGPRWQAKIALHYYVMPTYPYFQWRMHRGRTCNG